MTRFALTFLLCTFFISLFSQAPDEPKDLLMNVTVATDWSTVEGIENSFNAARRQEEMQLGLAANSIQNLDLPGQNTWNAYSADQKALYIANDERTSRAGINYGTGPVKGLPFNGIEAGIDAVAQNWSQYLINNNIFEHCHPTNNNADCPAGRISAAYPGGCTEFGGGIENLYAHSSGTQTVDEAVCGAIFGWNYVDAGSNWGHRHAMLSQSYDDDYGEMGQEGFVGFGIAQTANPAVTWKTIVTINFTNPVSDAQATNCGYNVTVTTNSLIQQPCTPPTITNVVATQPPSCANQVGSIAITATGTGTIEYSVNNGTTWQAGSTFNNLAPGQYTVVVRFTDRLDCPTVYGQNPVVINEPANCNTCSTGTNMNDVNIVDLNTVTSTINVNTNAVITDVNVTLNGTHTYVGDLTFTLVSPQNTSVVLLAKQCDGADNFSITFDDQAANAFACPMNGNQTQRPANLLSAFNGQNAQGTWTLQILDDANADQGILDSWSLEICVPMMQCTPPTINSVVVSQPTCTPQSGSITVNATGGGTLEYSIDNGMTWQLGNVFNNLAPGNNNQVIVRLQADPSCLTTYNMNPVVLNEPQNCDPCLTFNAADLPKNISEAVPTTVSTLNFTTNGTIQDVNVRNLMGNHTYVGDLTFTLISPQNTSVVLLAQQCGTSDNFNISFDDEAATAFACPMNDGQTRQPANALSAFDGENSQGTWTLQVNDAFTGDQGALTGWSLEICVQAAQCTPPVINSVTATAPTCEVQTSTVTINATGNSTLEYSINNGANWQAGNVFNNVAPGNYSVIVRLQNNVNCLTNYTQNPLVINAAENCTSCLTFTASDLPKAILDNNTITSTLNVNRQGTITDIRVRNVTGTHTYVSDLTFTLVSPQNTSVVLLAGQCTSTDDFNISFDDMGAALVCPLNTGQTVQPQNALAVLKGQNAFGDWKLQVNDNQDQDQGNLTGWQLEICGTFQDLNCPTNLNVDNAPIVGGGGGGAGGGALGALFQAAVQVTCMSTVGAGNNVTFQAGNNCELRPNFEVQQNAQLQVRIAGCNTN